MKAVAEGLGTPACAAEGRRRPLKPAGSRGGLRPLGRWAVAGLGGGLSRFVGRAPGAGFGILTYHRVTPWAGNGPATWNVTPQQLRAQLAGLLARGYQAWPLRKALAVHAEGGTVPRHAFVVTFDDGFENLYTHAWPVLRELGVPATVFLATAYLDSPGPFPFDDWPAAGRADVPAEAWRPLSTAQCREMAAAGGIELGSHTHTHANFRGRPAELARDLAASLEVLRHSFGLSQVTFSFPFGVVEADMVVAARRAGVLCGLTTQAVLVRPGCDPFGWGRFDVEDGASPSALAARLDGWYSLGRAAWLRFVKPWLGAPGTVAMRGAE